MTVHFELFATGDATPEATWALVGDPHRLPVWTDVERVERVAPDPVEVGTELAVVADGRRWVWQVVTADARLLEATTETSHGRLGIGLRVAHDPVGARLVVACAYEPVGGLAAVRVRFFHAPALRRRFDRWIHAALRGAAPSKPDGG